jgi:hypothetical protein
MSYIKAFEDMCPTSASALGPGTSSAPYMKEQESGAGSQSFRVNAVAWSRKVNPSG